MKQTLAGMPVIGLIMLRMWRLIKDPYFGAVGDKIAARLPGWKQRTIVQIGANDGRRCDPVAAIIKSRRRWRVLFVEPIPSVFKSLVSNYGTAPRFMFECSAVGTSGGFSNFYYLAEEAKTHALVWQEYFDLVGSLDRAHVVRALDNEVTRLEKFIIETTVPVITLDVLLEKWKINEIDALIVDAEGYDWKIVVQALELGLRPTVMLFEHFNLDAAEREMAIRRLHDEYLIEDIGIDFFCTKK